MSGFDRPGDAAGAETLEIMSAAPNYNRWQYDQIAPHLGRRILEIGSGIGNMSQLMADARPELLVCTDLDEFYRQRLRERFAGRDEVRVDSLALPDEAAAARFADARLDTVVALNVVEHIEDHVGTLRTMGSLVGPAGRVVVLVPALPALHGSLDEDLGHFRRYTPATLRQTYEAAGLRVDRLWWFNRVGVVGWWYNARVRRTRRIPLAQLKSFDALVPLLRLERWLPLPFGQSVIAVGAPRA